MKKKTQKKKRGKKPKHTHKVRSVQHIKYICVSSYKILHIWMHIALFLFSSFFIINIISFYLHSITSFFFFLLVSKSTHYICCSVSMRIDVSVYVSVTWYALRYTVYIIFLYYYAIGALNCLIYYHYLFYNIYVLFDCTWCIYACTAFALLRI